jgi:phytoene dehydrogenase-like protein
MEIAVVGAGVTGLAAAALMAGRHRVTLLEATDRIGGVAAACELDGQRFCPGPQFFWGFGEGGEGSRILGRIGLRLPMRAMPADFDQLSVGGPFAPVRRGACGPLLEALIAREPRQAGPVARFSELLDDIGEACVLISRGARFMDRGASMLRRVLGARGLAWRARLRFLRYHRDSVARAARRVGLGDEALRLIAYHQGIFAERLESLSVVLFAAARYHLKRRLYVPEGGTWRLIQGLAERARERGAAIETSAAVSEVRRRGGQLEVCTPGRARRFDRVVFACAPAVAGRLLPGLRLRYEPGYRVSALCLSVDGDSQALRRLHHRNFTWYRAPADDVDFQGGAGRLDYLNFTSPTLNGEAAPPEAGARCVVMAFYPGGDEDPALADEAQGLVTAALGGPRAVRVRERRVIGRRQWERDFGCFQGAVYGRRLTSASIRRSVIGDLPPGVFIAHSGAGISGIMGCLEMAERVAEANHAL